MSITFILFEFIYHIGLFLIVIFYLIQGRKYSQDLSKALLIKKKLLNKNKDLNYKNAILSKNYKSLKNHALFLNNQIQMYRDLFDISQDGIAIYSLDRKMIFYNQTFLEMWEFDKDFLDKNPFYDSILDYFLIERNFIIEINLLNYKKSQIELFQNIHSPKEELLYISDGRVVKVFIIPNKNGDLLFYYNDMTKNLVSERSYNQLIKIYKSAIDCVDDCIFIFSRGCRLYLYNDQCINMFNLDKQFLNEKPIIDEICNKMFLDDFLKEKFTYYIQYIDEKENRDLQVTIFNNKFNIKVRYLAEGMVMFLYSKIN